MNFSRDIQHERHRVPRTMNDAFGPYAKLHVPRRSEAITWLYVIGAGVVIGIGWWLLVGLRAGGGS